jgi:CRISPR/Cas system CSM-associated protein Csm3 (group 7 of RAMP superfamily)
MKNKLQLYCTAQLYKILYLKIRGLFNFAVGNRNSKTSKKGRLVNEENLVKSDRDPISETPIIPASTWKLGKPRKTQTRYPLFW